MTDEEIMAMIDAAIEHLKGEIPPLDFRDVHERTIAQRLAVQMETPFQGWNVDCEYNRDRDLIKRLPGILECDEQRRRDTFSPDIIVHHRGRTSRANNLIVIELKNNNEEDPCDRMKLELMTNPNGHYQYQLGLYINIDGGVFALTWYKDGNRL